MKKVRELVNVAKEKIKGMGMKIGVATAAVLGSVGVNTFALPSEDGLTMANNALTTILEYVRALGMFVAVFGVIGFIIAYKNNNSESQTNAAMFFVVGLLLCSIKPVLSTIGIL